MKTQTPSRVSGKLNLLKSRLWNTGFQLSLGALLATAAHAEFDLNFQANPNRLATGMWAATDFSGNQIRSRGFDCNRGSNINCAHGQFTDPEKTPFLLEIVPDPVTGQNYFHMIVGDLTAGFAQESYVKVSSSFWPGSNAASSSGGGMVNGGGLSTGSFPGFGPLLSTQSNHGNATGNPTTAQIRQVLTSGEISQEFLKNTYVNKPKISQTLTTAEVSAQFVLDMSTIPYTGAAATSTPAIITNTLDFADTTIPGKFNMATDKQNSTVSAGRFTWTPGTNSSIGNAGGVYSYAEGGANVDTIDWMTFYNPANNTCWSYNGPAGCVP